MTPERNDGIFPAKLKDSLAFLPVAGRDGSGTPVRYYGGDQAWYGTRVGRISGCGAVAAADVFAYLARKDPAYAALFRHDAPELTVEGFLEHMGEVIRHVRPSSIPGADIPYGGLTSIPRFMRYCEAFAQSRGVALKAHCLTNRTARVDEAVRAVAEQLAQDNPVAMLNMQNRCLQSVKHTDASGNPAESDLRFHWVVLTALEERDGKFIATASSEGCRVEFDFTDAWTCDARSVFGWRGLVYFS